MFHDNIYMHKLNSDIKDIKDQYTIYKKNIRRNNGSYWRFETKNNLKIKNAGN